MLTLTPTANDAIAEILESSPIVGGGVRIAAGGQGHDDLSLMLVAEPERGDRELADTDVPVYVDPDLAGRLAGRALHAEVDREEGRVAFVLIPAEEA